MAGVMEDMDTTALVTVVMVDIPATFHPMVDTLDCMEAILVE